MEFDRAAQGTHKGYAHFPRIAGAGGPRIAGADRWVSEGIGTRYRAIWGVRWLRIRWVWEGISTR